MHVNGLSATIQTGITDDLSKLKAKAVEFMRAYTDLDKMRPDAKKYPKEYAKWKELKDYGDKVKSSVKRITGAIDTAGNVVDSIYYGVTHPFGLNPFGLEGLGLLPLIPAAGVAITGAVIASSIAAMTYFITSAYEYGKFADASPEVRAELTKRAASTGITGMLGSVTGLLIVAGAIYAFQRMKK